MSAPHRPPLPAAILLATLLASCTGLSRPAAQLEPRPGPQTQIADGLQTPEGPHPQPTSTSTPTLIPWPKIDGSQTLRFDRWSIEEGLSQSVAGALLQDQEGFLWIGTEDGLNRFDGVEFMVFRSNPANPAALSNNHVTALVQAPDRTIWVGTYGGGLDRYDPATRQFHNYRHVPADPASLSDDQVQALLVDRLGMLWVGTLGGGLNRLESGSGGFLRFQHEASDPGSLSNDVVRALAADATGALWIGTDGGLDWLASGSSEFKHYRADPQEPVSLPAAAVTSLFLDSAGRLWIGTAGGGLARYRPSTDDFARYQNQLDDPSSLSSDVVHSIQQDPSGQLWVGTDNGLNRLDPTTGRFLRFRQDPADPHSLPRDQVVSLLLDRSGGLWAGTYGGGLSRLDPARLRFAHYAARGGDPSGLSRAAVWAIYEDRIGILWIGTDGGGLDRFDRRAGVWDHYRHDPYDPASLASDTVLAIFQDRRRVLWIGTAGGGLNRLNRFERNFTHYRHDPQDPDSLSDDRVWFIREDREGALWVGTQNGLNRFDQQTGRFQRFLHDPADPYSLADNNVGSFYQDRTGRIWVGTHEAFHRYEPESGHFLRYQHDPSDPASISHNIVFAIHEDQAGTLWLGTWGGGLNRFDPTSETFTSYRTSDGLPNDVVYGILEDELGRLWLSTNGGLSCFDPRRETFTNFDAEDGLQSNEFSYNAYFRNGAGELFFGGINGFNVFSPTALTPLPPTAPVVLTSLSHDGETSRPGLGSGPGAGPLILKWPDNSLDFEFTSPSFFQAEQNQYAYRLEGFDQDWNYVETRGFGRYTNLPGGEYTLQVRAANSEGRWNESIDSLPIRVLPPFWATWWFRGLALLVVAAGGYASYRYRIHRVEARSRTLERQIQERTHSLEQHGRDLERRRKELEALYRADEELLGRLDLDAVLQALVDTAVDILEADKGGVFIWDERRGELVVRASKGFLPATVERMRFAPGQGLAGTVYATGKPMAVEDARSDARVTRAIVDPEGIRAMLQVPVRIGQQTYGVFSADYTRPRRFDEETQKLLVSLANHAAIAIENANLYAQARQSAASEERTRLARDLHDAVTQTLFSASLIAEALPSVWEEDRSEGVKLLQELRQLNRGALAEMRSLLMELRPAALEEARLGDLMRQLAAAVSGRSGLPVTVSLQGECALPRGVHLALYRIAQEALNNVVKHANASRVEISLKCVPEPITEVRAAPAPARHGPSAGLPGVLPGPSACVELCIRDDGMGFDPARVPPECLGLEIIRERARTAGASVAIDSQRGRGTYVVVTWEG